jgi:DNA-binding transcriptional MerR regulator
VVEGLGERSHLSIGEVLSLLRDEFPDVTISKIRFLESQGLVDPERTPSGYRKFYDQDVERLRWILLQQREHYMPLKVIRSRLSASAGADEPTGSPVRAPLAVVEAETVQIEVEPEATAPEPDPAEVPAVELAEPETRPTTPSLFANLRRSSPGPVPPAEVEPEEASVEAPVAEVSPPEPAARPDRGSVVAGAEPARPATAATAATPTSAPDDPETYTPEELAGAAGADLTLIGELKQYGLITPHAAVAGTQYYDDGALAVARAAAAFARHGVEARHLRIWKNAADRESDLMQQVVLPLLRQRNPQARRQALDTLSDLSRAGADLRAALVERAVRNIR